MTCLKTWYGAICRGLLVVLLSMGGLSSPVFAQHQGGVDQFVPTAGWALQTNSLSKIRGLTSVKLPCMISNGYDNGFVVRFSGNDKKVLAMAIDFRQKVFHRGRQYEAKIELGQSYKHKLAATAFGENVLIFNMRKLPDFRGALNNAYTMTLDVEGNVFNFALGDVIRGLTEMSACFKHQDDQAAGMKNVSITPDSMPSETQPDWKDVPSAEKVMPSNSSVPAATGQLWQARAGADLKQTLHQWATQAGVDLSWQAGEATRIASDIQVRGSFEEAVQTLMAQQATAQGFEASLVGTGSTQVSSSTQVPRSPPAQALLPSYQEQGGKSISSVTSASTPPMAIGSGKWVAPAGSSLRAILEQWSAVEGVELVWGANQGFAVKRSINLDGVYETALQSLLTQFMGDADRPVAQLNNDPVSGKRTLFIESTRVL